MSPECIVTFLRSLPFLWYFLPSLIEGTRVHVSSSRDKKTVKGLYEVRDGGGPENVCGHIPVTPFLLTFIDTEGVQNEM